jgi:prepilin-type N-terminal cleavage/methylation domain-containing protein
MNIGAQASRTGQRQAGYTLIDMMVVILIIGVLGSLGFNQYGKYVARARRPETLMSFRAIASSQREFLLTHGKYAGTFDQLGFNVQGGKAISPTEIQGYTYNYRIIQDLGPRSWYVIATGNIDGDPFPDIIAASNPR